MIPNERPTPLQIAVLFHETYERLAPDFGYETRSDTKQFEAESKNGRLMVAVCAEVMTALIGPLERSLAERTKERDEANEKIRTMASPAVQGVLAKMAAPPMTQAMDDMRKNLEILDRVKSERDEALAKLAKCRTALGRVKQEHEHFGYGFEDCRDKVIKTLEETK